MTDAPSDDVPADMTAAELALGLLEGEERATALRRVLAEPAFARSVEAWRMRFAQLFDLWPQAEAPEGLVERIDAGLSGPRVSRVSRFPWPLLATVSTALAAGLLLVVALRPAPLPVPAPVAVAQGTGAVLVASIAAAAPDAPGTPAQLVGAVYQPASGSLRVAAGPVAPADRVAQLWIIGGDGKPYSLGLLGARATVVTLTPADRARIAAGVTLAISIEPTGGSPTGLPTGPVVGTGGLTAV